MHDRMAGIVSELRARDPSDVRPHALAATDDSASLLSAFIQHYKLDGVLEIVDMKGSSTCASPTDVLEPILLVIAGSHPAPAQWPVIERAKQALLAQLATDALGAPGTP